jgi:hypothetical protein
MIIVHVAALLSGIVLLVVAIVLFLMNTGPENPSGQLVSFVWVRFITFPIAFVLIMWGGTGITIAIRRSGHAKAKPRTKTADENLRVYEATDSRSPLIAELPQGTEIEPGTVKEVDGADWTSLKLSDGRAGYVVGALRFYEALEAVLERDTPVYESSLASAPISQLPAGTELEINGTGWDSGSSRVSARVKDGNWVFITSSAKLRWL